MCDDAGVQEAGVQLRSSALRGNGLFCTNAVDEGAVVLRIPLDACLVFQRDPEQARPSPSSAVAGPKCWSLVPHRRRHTRRVIHPRLHPA